MQQTGGGGGSEPSRELARFRSAPASWLEALLESEEEEDVIDPRKPTRQSPPTSSVASAPGAAINPDAEMFPAGGSVFLRQNSSPPDFHSQTSSASEGYVSNFGIPANYCYSASGKASRRVDSDDTQVKLSTELSGEHGGLLDSDTEKMLEDSVPCRVRAKRGCATHPRSIAERVRRTRISDRIRKLQELVPNMDKQTNTADMLEEAVEYVKFLQRQIQELTDHQNKCICHRKD